MAKDHLTFEDVLSAEELEQLRVNQDILFSKILFPKPRVKSNLTQKNASGIIHIVTKFDDFFTPRYRQIKDGVFAAALHKDLYIVIANSVSAKSLDKEIDDDVLANKPLEEQDQYNRYCLFSQDKDLGVMVSNNIIDLPNFKSVEKLVDLKNENICRCVYMLHRLYMPVIDKLNERCAATQA